MSVILQFNCQTHNETARKAMESYSEILQKAFEHYQNLWDDYIKLQEKCGQCNVHSSSQITAVNTPCMKTKDEAISQHLNNVNVQESNSISILELDAINISPINFNSDMETGSSDVSKSLHKNTDENNPPVSPVFSRPLFLKTVNDSAKKFVGSPKAVYNNNSTSNMNTHRSIEKVSSKHNHHKLEISTTHHVETTFLPNGKRLKQSRLAFYPVKSNEKMSSSVDKHKSANTLHSVKQNFIEDVSITNATANTTVTENGGATNNTGEISDDVIEVSPTQGNVISKVKRCLKLKRKNPIKHVKNNSPRKNKCPSPSAVPEIIDIDFGLCPSPKHTFTQLEDKSLMNTAVNTLKDKVNISYLSPMKMHKKTDIQIKKSIEVRKEDQLLINKVQKDKVLIQNINDFTCEDETFYLPAEQTANRNDMDNFNFDDTENKPPEKKMLLDKFNVLPKRKADNSEQLNIRCKADRAKLNGWDCWECREYYKNLSLPKEELQKRRNQCSRHRHKYERPITPEGFWDPEFPETLSCTYQENKS